MIARCHSRYDVSQMCSLMGVSRSGYYAWKRRPTCARRRDDERLKVEILASFRASRGSYGAPRIRLDLRELGFHTSQKRVARLMVEEGIAARQKSRFLSTTDSEHGLPVVPNVLSQDFEVAEIDTVWSGDITYVPTREGWLYLAILLDLASRYVVGWATSESLEAELTLAALDRALAVRRPPRGLIHHSDQGSQYASYDYGRRLAQCGLVASMSRRGNCYDNAPSESFFSSFKTAWMPKRGYESRDQARAEIFEYIEVFYNRKRRHSSIGGVSPARYEQRVRVHES